MPSASQEDLTAWKPGYGVNTPPTLVANSKINGQGREDQSITKAVVSASCFLPKATETVFGA